MKEIREPPTSSRRRLVFTTSGGVAPDLEGVANRGPKGHEKRKTPPRRSNSLNYHPDGSGRSTSSNFDLTASSSGLVLEHATRSPNHQFPLRETVSLTQLPGGERSYGPSHPVGVSLSGSGFSASMKSLPSGRQFDSNSRPEKLRFRMGHVQGSMETLPSYPRDKNKVRG